MTMAAQAEIEEEVESHSVESRSVESHSVEPRRQPRLARRSRGRDERGEGVISAAIAVLIMAFLGVAMWFAFSVMFQHTSHNINNQVNCIGHSSSNC